MADGAFTPYTYLLVPEIFKYSPFPTRFIAGIKNTGGGLVKQRQLVMNHEKESFILKVKCKPSNEDTEPALPAIAPGAGPASPSATSHHQPRACMGSM